MSEQFITCCKPDSGTTELYEHTITMRWTTTRGMQVVYLKRLSTDGTPLPSTAPLSQLIDLLGSGTMLANGGRVVDLGGVPVSPTYISLMSNLPGLRIVVNGINNSFAEVTFDEVIGNLIGNIGLTDVVRKII